MSYVPLLEFQKQQDFEIQVARNLFRLMFRLGHSKEKILGLARLRITNNPYLKGVSYREVIPREMGGA